MPNIPGAIKQIGSDIGEAIVKPVVDEVGKALETGVTTIVSGPQSAKPQDPAAAAAKKSADENKKLNALRVVNFYKKLQEDQQKIRDLKKQKEMVDVQEKKQEEQVKQFEIKQKESQKDKQLNARNTTESRKGVGG